MTENTSVSDITTQPPFRPFRYLCIDKVMEITGLARPTIYRYMADGYFPKQVGLGGRKVAWVDYEVYEWNHQRLLESRAASK